MRDNASRLRPSPNEEAQLVREELDRRRKLRLQQVREQERFIAQQVRRQVQERRQQQLQTLTDSLQQEWQQQHALRLQALHTQCELSLRAVGHGQRSAQENEPDLEALSQKREERRERAEERHREALRELSARRHEEQQQQCRHIEARRRALLEERKRAERVSSLPPPPAHPVETVVLKTPRPLKPSAEHFSATHSHMTQTAVDRETDVEQQLSAQQAAALELMRLEELRREEARDTQERLEKARLRGKHALRREQHTQDRARLLCELERLHQADLLRRRQAVGCIPAQIFQPLYRQEELRDEQQRDLEIAFQDMYTEERKVKGDLVLQLVPEPLPPPSTAGHDEELDVTLDPECGPEGEEPDTPPTESSASSAPPADAGRRALTRLLERIRRPSDQRSRRLTTVTSCEGDADEEDLSVETGSLSSQDKTAEESSETPSITHTEDAPDVSDEAVVAGTLLLVDERVQQRTAERERRPPISTHEVLLRQQEQQLALLEEKRREFEQCLRETQQINNTLQDADPRHPGIHKTTAPPGPPREAESDDSHTHRLHQYQQRLLQQNRLHKECVEEARRRLQEYQHALQLRYAIGSVIAAQARLGQPVVTLDTMSGRIRPDQHTALPLALNPDPKETPDGLRPCLPVQLQSLHRTVTHQQQHPVGSEWTRPSVLSGASPLDTNTEDTLKERVPLPPPSVVLELLRAGQHHAPIQSAEIIGAAIATSSSPAGPVQMSDRLQTLLQTEVETDRQETVRQHMARQKDALQALIRSDAQGRVLSSTDAQGDQRILNTLLRVIEEANGHTEPPSAHSQRDGASRTPQTLSRDGVFGPSPVNRGKVKPPVSRPPARLALLQQIEQHELSAIQEVDTPVNVSLDSELKSVVGVSESNSASLSAVTSEDSHSEVSEGSRVSGRISRVSWRDTLLQDSSVSSISQQQQERFSAALPTSVDPDYLSSTTISTGSFSSSDREASFTAADAAPLSSSPSTGHMSIERSKPMRDPVWQIIEKYSKALNASLTHAGVVNSSSRSLSWSSVLQEEDRAHHSVLADGHTVGPALRLSSSDISGVFLPLQPHPDIDDSSSSSSRNAERDNQSGRAQGWSRTVNQILEHLCDQLSVRRTDQSHGSTTAEAPHQSPACLQQDRHSSLSGRITNDGAGHFSHPSPPQPRSEPQDRSSSDWCESVLSQVIGRGSDMDSSQVFDQSGGGLEGITEGTVMSFSPDRSTQGGSPALQRSEQDESALTNAPQDEPSDVFLPLPSDVTHGPMARHVPLGAEATGTSDWLESTDQFHHSPEHLRSNTPTLSGAQLQISIDQLSLTHESLCEADTVVDVSRMTRSPFKTGLQEESPEFAPQLPSQEVMSCPEMPQQQSCVQGEALTELLERAQAAGDVKGILEESVLSFVSLPDSDLTLTHAEDPGREPQEVMFDRSEDEAPRHTVEDSAQSERPELAFPLAVMRLEFQCSPARRQRQDHLAQRSALRAAQIKDRHASSGRTTPVPPNVCRATADRLKSVCQVRICSEEHRRETEMHRRTHRLYGQLEEVKQWKELQIRRESYAKNRERARDFQRKTLEKLRAKFKR